MGLDISFFRKLQPVGVCTEAESDYCNEHFIASDNEDFPGRMDGLKEGVCYAFEGDRGHLHAGSYGGYNRWREQLAALVGTTPRAVWDGKAPADLPFAELINFSDCEGTIGPVVSAKLARDFAEWDDRARASLDGYAYAKYQEWRRAFETAADSGAVDFH